MRRRLLTLAAVAGALLALPVAAHAGSVEVIAPDGSRQTVDLGQNQSEQDVRGQSYTVDGDEREIDGFTLAKVLSLGGVGATEWDSARVAGSIDYDESDRFEDGDPVFYEDDGQAVFILPESGGDDAQTRRGQTITLEAFDSSVDLEITPTAAEIDPGDSVKFSVSSSGEVSRYAWQVGGVGSQSGRTVTFDFPKKPGSYPVSVTAYSGNRDVGRDGTFVIVGKPKKSPKDRDGGGDNKKDDAPESGSFGGPDGTGTGTGRGQGDDGAGSGTDSPGDKSEPNAPDTPTVDVLGEVLGQSEVAQQAAAEAGSARDGTPVEKSSVPGVVIGLAAILALYGLGAGRELKPKRKREAS